MLLQGCSQITDLGSLLCQEPAFRVLPRAWVLSSVRSRHKCLLLRAASPTCLADIAPVPSLRVPLLSLSRCSMPFIARTSLDHWSPVCLCPGMSSVGGAGGEPLCAPVRLQHRGQRLAQCGIRFVFVGSYLTNEACASIQVSRDTHFAGAEGRCPPQQRSACWLWSVPTQQERTAVKGRAQTDGCGFRG